jgi:hypothetical protein
LLNLPGTLLSAIVYAVSAVYAVSYILAVEFKSQNPITDRVLLVLGGYASGTSLIGAPLIAAVYLRHVSRQNLRETLIVLWGILVVFKMSAFVYTGIDLQLLHQVWLLPCAAIGHVMGLKVHQKLLTSTGNLFMRLLGSGLLVVTLVGVWLNFL